MVEPVRDKAWFRRTRALFARPVAYPAFTPSVHRQLTDYYRDDILQLERLIGRDLQSWTRNQDATQAPARSSTLSAPTAGGGGLVAKGS